MAWIPPHMGAVWSAHHALTLADQSYDSEGDGWNGHPVAVEQRARIGGGWVLT